jgi:hypothetical protein
MQNIVEAVAAMTFHTNRLGVSAQDLFIWLGRPYAFEHCLKIVVETGDITEVVKTTSTGLIVRYLPTDDN